MRKNVGLMRAGKSTGHCCARPSHQRIAACSPAYYPYLLYLFFRSSSPRRIKCVIRDQKHFHRSLLPVSFLLNPVLSRSPLIFVRIAHALQYILFFFSNQPLSISENPFAQSWHAFVQDYFSSASSLLLASVVPNAPILCHPQAAVSRHQRHAFISPDLPLRPLWQKSPA